MFISLNVKNGFYDSDNITINFTHGLNVLTGPNGSGKSHTIDLLNYSLFGTQALRSSITEYPNNFKVICEFKINNNVYKVERTTKTSKLYLLENNKYEIQSTSTTAVNNTIKELLSYDYKIFSLTNYVKQNNLLNLTSCTPSALAELIQIISGISSSELLENHLRELTTTNKAENKALENTKNNLNVSSIEFSINEQFEKLLSKDSNLLNTIKDDILEINKKINFKKDTVKQLETINNQYHQFQSNLQELERYKDYTLETLTDSLIELNNIQNKIQNLKNYLNNVQKPEEEFHPDYLLDQEYLIIKNDEYKAYLKAKEQFESNQITCPNCQTNFCPGHENVIVLEAPEKPCLTLQDIKVQLDWIKVKEAYKASQEELEALETVYNNLPDSDEIKFKIEQVKKYNSVNQTYIEILNTLKSFIESFNIICEDDIINSSLDLKSKLENEIPEQEEFLEYNRQLEKDIVNYISNKKYYELYLETVTNLENNIKDNNNKQELLTLLRAVLTTCKKEIQSQVLPLINTTSSKLLSTMTGGERSSIEIDKSFQIQVDGQKVDVLEGSGQVLTNICLRIAMLNTFYKDSFLVFIGDEIDSPLHEDRFAFLEKSLDNLSNLGYQIIIISHKDFNTGNIIDMGSL